MNKGIEIQFVQVKSHQEDLFNEMADTICKKELNIDNDGVLEKYLLKDKIIVKNQDIKGQIENLVQSGRENIVVLKEDKKSINSAKKEKNSNDINVKRDNIAIDKNSDEIYRKNELIEKINHILQNLENERLEEVLRYVKRKKNQKNK